MNTSGPTPEHTPVASARWLPTSLPLSGFADGVAKPGNTFGQRFGKAGGRCCQSGHGVARRSGGKTTEIAGKRLQWTGSFRFELRNSGLGLGWQSGATLVVERLLKSIRKRPDDDSVLKTLQKMLWS